MEIEGKVAVLTGAASGIGKATAVALAQGGADVVLADVNDERLAEVKGEIEVLGCRVLTVHTDVSKLEAVQSLFDQSISEMGRVDILMNNAGVHLSGPVDKVSIDDWEWIIGINLWSVIYGVHIFLPHMLERGSGHIVNTASIAGLIGWKDPAIPYTATKFAIVGISEGLAAYLKNKGVGVTVICPDIVLTDLETTARFIPAGDGLDPARRKLLDALHEGQADFLELLASLQIVVLRPEEVAVAVVDAIRKGTCLVTPHPGTKEMMLQRALDFDGMIAEAASQQQAREGLISAAFGDGA